MSRIIFCATKEAMRRRITEGPATDGASPFVLDKASDIRGAIEALKSGRDVVANAHATAIGWKAPEGTTVELDEDMSGPGLEALRFQSESRVHRADVVPVRVKALLPGADLDARILRALRGRAEDPFSDANLTGTGPESP